MNVTLSCHLAFVGKNAFAAVDAVKPINATPANEYAEVAVKNSGCAAASRPIFPTVPVICYDDVGDS